MSGKVATGKGRRPAVRAGGGGPARDRGATDSQQSANEQPASPARPEEGVVVAKQERRVAARAPAGRPGSARDERPRHEPAPSRTAVPALDATVAAAGQEDPVQPKPSFRDGASAVRPIAPHPVPVESEAEGLLQGARQLLSTDYYFKQWGRLGMRGRSEQVDDFGLDPTYEARLQPWLDLLYERYFRVRLEGAARIPAQGAALLVCNHAGALPWDGVILKTALRQAQPGRPGLRWLTDDYVFHSPFLGPCLNRIGAVRACPENADRLLSRGELLAVFPEGTKGIGKLYRERYQLQRFGRGGHVKLALRMGVPLIPMAIVGSEESYPLVYKVRAFSKALGMPFIPVTPLFPWLGPLGLVPLPSRWQIVVGEPMRELEQMPTSAADDSMLVNDLNEQLRAKVQALLQEALAARGPAF